MAQMHGSRLPAGEALCALPVPMRFYLCQSDQGAGSSRTEELGQYQTRADHAPEYLLEGGRPRRLPESVLEIHIGTLAAWRYRGPDRFGVDRTSPDHVRARRIGRSAECIELLDAVAASLCSRRVTGNESAGAVVPHDNRSARFDAGPR